MTDSQIIEQVKETLGYPVVSVYTPDTSIKSFLTAGFDLLSSTVLRQVTLALPCSSVQKLNKEEIPLIIDVVPYTSSGDKQQVYIRDAFSLTEAIEYFNVNSQGILAPILANISYNQINYAFNNAFDWHYDRHTGELYATNIPSNASILAATAKIYYTRETLTKELETWLFEYTLAKTKIVEGRIRSKYKEGSVGAVSDGESLLSEGNAEVAALKEELKNFVPLNIGRRR